MQPEMEFVKFLGKGSYGSVNLLRYPKPDGSMFYNAVKITDSQLYNSLSREFQILTELKGCSGIIKCFGDSLLEDFDYKGDKVYKMIMEYASGGTLSSFMELNKNLSESMIKDFTRMILQGLVSIHNHGYVHCDLKPENILLFPAYDEETWDCSYVLKISDFGMSTKAGEKSDYWRIDSPFVGTPIYMSPESVQNGVVKKSLDLWSLGCTVLEMYVGKRPWSGVDSNDLETKLMNNIAPEIPDTVPCEARKFLETCFARKHEDRGSASQLLLHPFLTGERITSAGGEKKLRTKKTKVIQEKHLKVKTIPVKPRKKKSKDIQEKPLKVKNIQVKPSQFKKVTIKPLKFVFTS